MQILSYSERGVLNTLFYETYFKGKATSFLTDFLSTITYPLRGEHQDCSISDATILLEQSFSDFGTSDVVLLVKDRGLMATCFIEAKVKTYQKRSWTIESELSGFHKATEKLSSSNLFSQLFYKTQLSRGLREVGIAELQESGIQFPAWSSKKKRKIGHNNVVLDASGRVQSYSDYVRFIALVPGPAGEMTRAFHRLADDAPVGFQNADLRDWGFITWEEVRKLCEEHDLRASLEVLIYNEGQIC